MNAKQIEKLKREYNLQSDRDVMKLYERLQSGEFDLSTPEGRAFDDEIYERAMAVRKEQQGKAVATATAAVAKQSAKTGKTSERKGGKRVVVLTKKEFLIRRILIWTLSIIMLGCFVIFAVYLADAQKAKQLAEQIARKKNNTDVQAMYAGKDVAPAKDAAVDDDGDVITGSIQPQVLDVYKSLYAQNKNVIGWIAIEGTKIDYPVMQTSDNEYYLNHDINQKEDKNGTLFMDCECDVLRPSMNFIIYGHNMRSGNMFGSLSKYKDESYYIKHPRIHFDTIYETGVYDIMYVFNSKIYQKDEIAFKYYQFIDAASKEEFDSNMREMAELSLYNTGVEAEYGDRLLTLSTCDYLEDGSRFVVVAKKVE
ncbi:MAG: class B sortase [Lachnospiraceae bacterium]|nr:class B sortase [Lachnospiraceae bacterium]